MGLKLRMVIAWGLFIAWVCWLSWQSFSVGRFAVVSRAQFLAAQVAVTAKVTVDNEGKPLPKVHVQSVVWPSNASQELVDKDLTIGNLIGCSGFEHPGQYVLPLTRNATGDYLLAGIPRSPLVEPSRHRPQIYAATPVVLAQIRQMPTAK